MKKIKTALLCIILVCTTFFQTACSGKPEPISKTGCYFDTVVTITLYCDDAGKYIDECFAMAERYEKLFSATMEGSDIYKLNHCNGQVTALDPETVVLIQEGIRYTKESNGSFDITVGNLSSIWQQSIKEQRLPKESDVSSALSTVSYKNVVINGNTVQLLNDTKIDLGGIAKGYIADRMKEYLLSQGVKNGLINLGGNVLAVGPKSPDEPMYNIAIQSPFSKNGEAIASVKITDQSVVTSGTYQRYFNEKGRVYHHILDLTTGYPCDNDLDSVTIICKKSIDGDALSTTVFLMGCDDGLQYVENTKDTEAIFITKKGDIKTTSGIGKDIPFQKQ